MTNRFDAESLIKRWTNVTLCSVIAENLLYLDVLEKIKNKIHKDGNCEIVLIAYTSRDHEDIYVKTAKEKCLDEYEILRVNVTSELLRKTDDLTRKYIARLITNELMKLIPIQLKERE